ncbi:MAG TPA: RsmE family RNA methyltransferase [Spirochaetota bacterium]
MPQYFINRKCETGKSVSITDDDFHHLKHVRRVHVGDGVYLRDADGVLFTGWIASIGDHEMIIDVASVVKDCGLEPVIVLGMSLLKHSNFELVVQKAVEVGVSDIVPLVTERTIIDLKGKESDRIIRWQKIADEASKQSMRSSIPVIHPPLTFDQFIEKEKSSPIRIITAPVDNNISLKSALDKQIGSRAALLVGPEGGFSPDEISRARDKDFLCVTIGSTQMRAETAGIVISALLLYEMNARFHDERN